jgi:hypothetical protein
VGSSGFKKTTSTPPRKPIDKGQTGSGSGGSGVNIYIVEKVVVRIDAAAAAAAAAEVFFLRTSTLLHFSVRKSFEFIALAVVDFISPFISLPLPLKSTG